LKASSLIYKYIIFAVIATLLNLAVQRLTLHFIAKPTGLIAALFLGTLVGLIAKYVLDKHWIFCDSASGVYQNSRKFGLYSLTGVLTTLIFWMFETMFWFIWNTELMREIGALIGLGFGYIIKFHLDRKFVFSPQLGENTQ
jgi:putative flippase GtrA